MDRAALYAMYKGDWAYCDALELVTWTPRGGAAVPNIKATRGDLAKAQLRFFGQEFADLDADTTMIIWDETITGVGRPEANKSTITDAAGVDYTIEMCKRVAYDTQWFLALKQKA